MGYLINWLFLFLSFGKKLQMLIPVCISSVNGLQVKYPTSSLVNFLSRIITRRSHLLNQEGFSSFDAALIRIFTLVFAIWRFEFKAKKNEWRNNVWNSHDCYDYDRADTSTVKKVEQNEKSVYWNRKRWCPKRVRKQKNETMLRHWKQKANTLD